MRYVMRLYLLTIHGWSKLSTYGLKGFSITGIYSRKQFDEDSLDLNSARLSHSRARLSAHISLSGGCFFRLIVSWARSWIGAGREAPKWRTESWVIHRSQGCHRLRHPRKVWILCSLSYFFYLFAFSFSSCEVLDSRLLCARGLGDRAVSD